MRYHDGGSSTQILLIFSRVTGEQPEQVTYSQLACMDVHDTVVAKK